MALCSDFLIYVGKIKTARERRYVIAETWPLYFWNQYNDGFQISYHKDLSHSYSILYHLNLKVEKSGNRDSETAISLSFPKS